MDRLSTPWTDTVNPDTVWSEYPRPGMVRERWMSINGLWEYAITGEDTEWKNGYISALADDLLADNQALPEAWDGQILVPFAVESALSGVAKLVRPSQLLWYRKQIELPADWQEQRILLHFEAVDWHAVVWINGVRCGEHRGGYVPFALDITDALRPGSQEIIVGVWDPTNVGDQAVGKQSLPEERKGYRYTPTTGIWQSVWLEPVPVVSFDSIRLTPDLDRSGVELEIRLRGEGGGCRWIAEVTDGERVVAAGSARPDEKLRLVIDNPIVWEPDAPFLYQVSFRLENEGVRADEVSGYFGMRKISMGRDADGRPNVLLNHKPIFQFGPLDQGYWPDGILTPPGDEAALFDIQYLKDIGCNMIRVHIKLHPARWYYHCDRLGLLVWQDMVCTRKFDPMITEGSAAQWETEQKEMLDHLHNHPSIVQWIVFNEAWGQYDTGRMTEWTMKYDPSRLVTSASGWTDYPAGHFVDIHDYSFYCTVPPQSYAPDRAIVLGECGGFDLLLPGHIWHPDQQLTVSINRMAEQGREKYEDARQFAERYEEWLKGIKLLRHQGLCAAVYTQITDVEHEPNGWLTYDRRISKIPKGDLAEWHSRLYEPLEPLQSLVNPDSGNDDSRWEYRIGIPEVEDWKTGGGDELWLRGSSARYNEIKAPAAEEPTPEAAEKLYCARTTFELDSVPEEWILRVQGRGLADVFLNGILLRQLRLNNRDLEHIHTADVPISGSEAAFLQTGVNVLAICWRMKDTPAADFTADILCIKE
jgi:hypothetical protein